MLSLQRILKNNGVNPMDLVYFLPGIKYKTSALPLYYAHNLAPLNQTFLGKCTGSPSPLNPALSKPSKNGEQKYKKIKKYTKCG